MTNTRVYAINAERGPSIALPDGRMLAVVTDLPPLPDGLEWEVDERQTVRVTGTFRRPSLPHHDEPRPDGYFTVSQVQRMFGLKGRTGHRHRGTRAWARRYAHKGQP